MARQAIAALTTAQKLKELLTRVETWPEPAQEELIRSAFDIEARYIGSYEPTGEDRAALCRSSDDIRERRFASGEEAAALFERFRHA